MSVREKSFGFWIVIAGLGALVLISLVAIFKYSAVADASGVVTAAGTVIGTVVGTFFGVHAGSAAGNAGAARAESGRQRAEAVKDTVVTGLAKVAAAAEPGSPTALAIQDLIDTAQQGTASPRTPQAGSEAPV
ncbi:MAG TPA: hypothetical protein VFP72_04220 [Kineosporiaceae bacterium]|nr:hypothetical protein [Kineosporiaceae bacterium]